MKKYKKPYLEIVYDKAFLLTNSEIEDSTGYKDIDWLDDPWGED